MRTSDWIGKKVASVSLAVAVLFLWLVVPVEIEKAFEGSQSISPVSTVVSTSSSVLSYLKAKRNEFRELQFSTPPARELVSTEAQRLKLGDEQGAPKERAYMETLRSEDRRMK